MKKEHMYNSEDNDIRANYRAIHTTRTQSILRTIFGIVMIIIYVGMGILLLINFFRWEGSISWTRYVVGIVLIIYGFWRAYRQYKGIDSRI